MNKEIQEGMEDPDESDDEDWLREVFRPRSEKEKAMYLKMQEEAERQERERQQEKEDIQEDPEWYYMKMAARKEKEAEVETCNQEIKKLLKESEKCEVVKSKRACKRVVDDAQTATGVVATRRGRGRGTRSSGAQASIDPDRADVASGSRPGSERKVPPGPAGPAMPRTEKAAVLKRPSSCKQLSLGYFCRICREAEPPLMKKVWGVVFEYSSQTIIVQKYRR